MGRRKSGRGFRRRSVPLYKPSKLRSRGNPRPKLTSASYSYTQTGVITTSAGGTATLTAGNIIDSVYASVGRTPPTTAADNFTYTIKQIRVAAAPTFAGQLVLYDVKTNFSEADAGTNSSRANCGIRYPVGLLAPVSSNISASTSQAIMTVYPAGAVAIYFEVSLDVTWKTSQNPEIAAIRSEYRDRNKFLEIQRLIDKYSRDEDPDFDVISESGSHYSMVPTKVKRSVTEKLKSMTVKGRAGLSVDAHIP